MSGDFKVYVNGIEQDAVFEPGAGTGTFRLSTPITIPAGASTHITLTGGAGGSGRSGKLWTTSYGGGTILGGTVKSWTYFSDVPPTPEQFDIIHDAVCSLIARG